MLDGVSIKKFTWRTVLEFIVTSTGKANENAAVICTRFYSLTLTKELALRGNHTSTPKTYET